MWVLGSGFGLGFACRWRHIGFSSRGRIRGRGKRVRIRKAVVGASRYQWRIGQAGFHKGQKSEPGRTLIAVNCDGHTGFSYKSPETAKPSLALSHETDQEGLMRDCWGELSDEPLQNVDGPFHVLQAAKLIRQLLHREQGVELAARLCCGY